MSRAPDTRRVIICATRSPLGGPGRFLMRTGLQILAVVLSSIVFSGCATTLYGYQSSASGTTVTSSRVVAATSGSNASVSFVYGSPVPPTAPGGHLTVSNSSSSGALAGVVLFGFLASYIVGEEGPKPLPPGTKILHTCSCYGYQPPENSESVNRESTEPVRQNGAEPSSF